MAAAVSNSCSASGCAGYAPIPPSFVAPHSGNFAACAAFDGAGPVNHTITQSFAVPVDTATATLSWYDALGFGSDWIFPQARVYSVNLLDQSGALVSTLFSESFTNAPGGVFQNWMQHTVDLTGALAALSGHTAEIQFNLFVPQSFTGPGVFALDDVSITSTVPEPGVLALLGIGLVGMALRRKSAAK